MPNDGWNAAGCAHIACGARHAGFLRKRFVAGSLRAMQRRSWWKEIFEDSESPAHGQPLNHPTSRQELHRKTSLPGRGAVVNDATRRQKCVLAVRGRCRCYKSRREHRERRDWLRTNVCHCFVADSLSASNSSSVIAAVVMLSPCFSSRHDEQCRAENIFRQSEFSAKPRKPGRRPTATYPPRP